MYERPNESFFKRADNGSSLEEISENSDGLQRTLQEKIPSWLQWFLFILSYFSDYVWAYPVKSRREGIDALKAFYNEHIGDITDNDRHDMFVILQSDRDSVAQSDEVERWLLKKGIVLQLSAAYKYNQNGQIERDMQNVLDKTRTLLAAYNVPVKWWAYALQNAVWNINRSPTSKNDNKSPIELVYGIKPSIDEMMVHHSFVQGCTKLLDPRENLMQLGNGKRKGVDSLVTIDNPKHIQFGILKVAR